MRPVPNARIWSYVNGDMVKLTLSPGQRLDHYVGDEHEEGWSSEAITWHYDGDCIYRDIVHDGTDCDGRMSHQMETVVRLDHLKERQGYPPEQYPDVRLPEWERVSASQRDYAAEAMGY